MNKYDSIFHFRMATIADLDAIMKFIHDEWGKNHILAHDNELFLWQYGRTEYGDYNNINFVLMLDKNNDTISGIIGFIAYDAQNQYISPAMTKVSTRVRLPMTGLEFMKRQMQIVGEKEHFASGTNPQTILPLYEKVFHHRIGIMQQYYILNPEIQEISEFKVAQPDKIQLERIVANSATYLKTEYQLKEIRSFEECTYDLNEINVLMPVKSCEFMRKRYFNHPIYSYKKWLVRDESQKTVGLLIGREIIQNETQLLRLVDYRGDLSYLNKLGSALHNLIKQNRYEYIDFMVSDLSQYHLEDAGFSLLVPDGTTIIPHYFEPFVQKNIKNYYQNRSDIIIFKADGDQDRPNVNM